MDDASIKHLNEINRRFYEITASNFDQTRQVAWPGWEKLRPYLSDVSSVLDVGCGNGRFGLFVDDTVDHAVQYHGIDNNAALLTYAEDALTDHKQLNATLTQHDIVEASLDDFCCYDLVVLFGVIHHVPGMDNRRAFMRRLADCVADDGLLVFASWRFYEYERFQQRVVAWDDYDAQEALTIEEDDYLLDWRRGERALRYCHYVNDAEQQLLIAASGLTHVETYRADGFTGDVNCYSVLRKSSA